MNWLVVDLEATCQKGSPDEFVMEVIEIGAVVLGEGMADMGRWERFVRPVINPELSEFCTELTSITQKQVDEACVLAEVWHELESFCHNHGVTGWASWGKWDYRQLERELAGLNVTPAAWFSNHVNLKQAFVKHSGKAKLKKMVGLKTACAICHVEMVLPQHRALADAVSTVRVVQARPAMLAVDSSEV